MKSEDNTYVKYTGKSAVEIGVGEFRQSFKPDEVVKIEDPRFRMELFKSPDFQVSNAKGEVPHSPKAQVPSPKSGESGESGESGDPGLTERRLMSMLKDDLLDMAEEMGAAVTVDNNKDEIVAKILAVSG